MKIVYPHCVVKDGHKLDVAFCLNLMSFGLTDVATYVKSFKLVI